MSNVPCVLKLPVYFRQLIKANIIVMILSPTIIKLNIKKGNAIENKLKLPLTVPDTIYKIDMCNIIEVVFLTR